MNPFATWADVLLKSGKAALESLQESAAKSRPARVAVIATPDAPQPRVRRKASRARAKPKAAPKRKRRARSAGSPARRR